MLRFAAVLAVVAAPAFSDSMSMANDLGAVLAGGEKCGYTFDKGAIIAFVRENVPGDDLGFASLLSTMVVGHGVTLDDLSEDAFIAQCAAVENTARHYGFMR